MTQTVTNNYVVDTLKPTITIVTSSTTDDSYKEEKQLHSSLIL